MKTRFGPNRVVAVAVPYERCEYDMVEALRKGVAVPMLPLWPHQVVERLARQLEHSMPPKRLAVSAS